MANHGYVFTNWSPRKESTESCASRLAQSLQALEEINSIFSSWSDAKRKEEFEVTSNPKLLTKLLNEGRNTTDFKPKRTIEELGFTVSLKTETDGNPLVFNVHCGAYHKEVLNKSYINFPEDGICSYKAVQSSIKVNALGVLIKSWDPDWGAICSWSLRRAMKANGIEPRLLGYLGWVTYVSNRRGELPEEVQRRFHVESVPSCGNLIFLTSEPPADEADANYVKTAVELYQLLERHGIYYEFPT